MGPDFSDFGGTFPILHSCPLGVLHAGCWTRRSASCSRGFYCWGTGSSRGQRRFLFGSGPMWTYHFVEALQGSIHGWTRTLKMIFDDLLMMFLICLSDLIWSNMIGSHLIISDLYCPVPAATLQFYAIFLLVPKTYIVINRQSFWICLVFFCYSICRSHRVERWVHHGPLMSTL